MKELAAVYRFGVHFWTLLNRGLNLKCSKQACHEVWDLPFLGVIFVKRSFDFESSAGRNNSRLPLQGEVLQLWWSSCPLMALNCVVNSCRCLRFLPGPFWYPVKDTWRMRDQALKLQSSVKHWVYRQQLFVRESCGCWKFLSLSSLSNVACFRFWYTLPSLYNTRKPSFSLLILTFLFHWESWASSAFR